MNRSPQLSVFLPGLNVGGAERVLLGIVSELHNRGVSCEIVTAQAGGRWLGLVPSAVPVVELGFHKPLHAVFALSSYLRRAQPEVILSSITSASIASLLACALPGIRSRCIVREANLAEQDISGSSWISRLTSRAAIALLYRRADGIVALSEGMKRHLASFSLVTADRIAVIPNPLLTSVQPGVDERRKHSGPRLIVACGRLAKQKDYPTLIRAVALVNQTLPARLVVLGEGPLLIELQELAATLSLEGLVTFFGHSEAPDEWMRQADVFALTSEWEGFPNVLLEAVASGCPVVATDCSDAVGEILDQGRFGNIVERGRPDLVADAILSTFASQKPLESPAQHLQKYSASTIVDAYLAVMFSAESRKEFR